MSDRGLPITLVEPATCVIRVRGVLAPDWSVRLGGMRIATTRSGGRAVTELIGRLADQASLHGVLSALYELGLPLVSVDCVPIDQSACSPPPAEHAPP